MLKNSRATGWRSLTCIVLALSLLLPAGASLAAEDGQVELKFWGRAKFDMQYDTGTQAVDFMSYLKNDEIEQFSFNPRDTRLGFKAGSTQGEWAFAGVFEIDFYGSNASNNLLPRLRLGYAEAKKSNGLSIRGGQDWVPVAQQNPGTFDFGIQSWSGNLWWRVPQLTLRYKPNNIEFLVSAMKHRVSNSQEQQEKMPWLLARMGFSDLIGKGSLVALGGGVRTASDMVFTKENPDPDSDGSLLSSTSDYNSYLIALEFKAPFAKGWEVKGEVYSGKGLGREYVHYGFDYNPWHGNGGKVIQSQGGFVSLKIPAGAKIHFNAGFGLDDPKDEDMQYLEVYENSEDLTIQGGNYLKNQTIFANMKYAVTKQFGWGLEVINFTTTVASGDSTADLKGQRYTASWWYIF